MTVYLEASAAAKLVVQESETTAVVNFLAKLGPGTPVIASQLLETELRRLAVRLRLPQSEVATVLDRVSLIHPVRTVWRDAGLLSIATLRSLDALHLATALREDASMMVTYDRRLVTAAAEVGLVTVSPA